MGQRLRIEPSRFRRVDLITAGENQVVVCAPVVYLEATVSGEMDGHAYEWEQIAGSPVVTLNPVLGFPNRTYYAAGANPGTDKIFRFYVDRGSRWEQFDDVTIFTTPSTNIEPMDVGYGINQVSLPYFAFTAAARFTVGAPFDPSIPFNSYGIASVGVPYTLDWALPEAFYEASDPDRDNVKRYYRGQLLEHWDGSAWVNPVVFTLTDALTAVVNPGERLRLSYLYQAGDAGQIRATPGDWFDTAEGGVACYQTVSPCDTGVGHNDVALQRVVYGIQLLSSSEDLNQTDGGVGYVAVDIDRVVYTLVPLTYDDVALQTDVGFGHLTFSVTRTGGGSLGG